MAVQTLIQVRRGTAATWTSTAPTLSAGEWGYETDTGKVKIGDGSSGWSSLPYLAIGGTDTFTQSEIEEIARDAVGAALTEGTGIGISVDDGNNTITVAVTGISHSLVNDFDSAVTDIIATGGLSAENVMDIVGTGLVDGTNTTVTYNDGANTVAVNVSGLDHTDISDFDNEVTAIMATGVAGSANSVAASGVTNLEEYIEDTVDGLLVEGSNIGLTYDDAAGTLTIDVTGLASGSHTHTLVDVTDVTATSTEVNYLDGTTLGTVTASNVVAVDSNKDITGFRNLTTDGNVTVGGDLTVAGTTTTVNSTTVEIGDNIIRVNTSGLSTGGLEVYAGGSNYQQMVWNTSNSRWEFEGQVYSDTGFTGDLTGNADTVTDGVYTTDVGTVTSTMIADGTIVNDDINASANIAVTKLAKGSAGQVLRTNAAGTAVEWGSIDGGSP